MPTPKRFDVRILLDSTDVKTRRSNYRRAEHIFRQGDASSTVMYLQTGKVKLSVRSKSGREATVATLRAGNFFGEGCMSGQPRRMGSATAVSASTVVVLEKKEMMRLLHEQPALANGFLAHLLGANVRIEADLIGQLFNHVEKRLARTLLLLGRYGRLEAPESVLPQITHAALAKMSGSSTAKVTSLLKKFKRLGFIEGGHGIKINNSLMSVVLHD